MFQYRRFTSADAWRYQSPKELGHIDYMGTTATYSGGGSIQDLDTLRNNTEAIIRVGMLVNICLLLTLDSL